MSDKRAVTWGLAVLVGLALGASALAAPTQQEGARKTEREVSFLEQILLLFRLDGHEDRRRPVDGKAKATAYVTGTTGTLPHHSSLRLVEGESVY